MIAQPAPAGPDPDDVDRIAKQLLVHADRVDVGTAAAGKVRVVGSCGERIMHEWIVHPDGQTECLDGPCACPCGWDDHGKLTIKHTPIGGRPYGDEGAPRGFCKACDEELDARIVVPRG